MKPYFTCTCKKDIECELLPTIYVDQDEDTISFRFLFWQIGLVLKKFPLSFTTPRITLCFFTHYSFIAQLELLSFRTRRTDFQIGSSFNLREKYIN